MWRANSLEMTLVLGKMESRWRRGQQRMRLLDGITDSVDMSESCLVIYDSLWLHGQWPAKLLCPEFFRQEYWSGLLCPFQGILPTQGSNLGHLYCRQVLYHLSHQRMDMSLRKFREMVRTGKPGVLQSMGLQRVQHYLVTEQEQHEVEHTYTLWSSNSIPSPRVFCSCGPRINMRKWLVQPRTQSHKCWCHDVHCASLCALPILSHKIL